MNEQCVFIEVNECRHLFIPSCPLESIANAQIFRSQSKLTTIAVKKRNCVQKEISQFFKIKEPMDFRQKLVSTMITDRLLLIFSGWLFWVVMNLTPHVFPIAEFLYKIFRHLPSLFRPVNLENGFNWTHSFDRWPHRTQKPERIELKLWRWTKSAQYWPGLRKKSGYECGI